MLARYLQAFGFAVLTAVACSSGERAPANDTRAARTRGDTAAVSTYEMSQALTHDVRESDLELTALQDSIYLFLGDTLATLLKQSRASWEQYRKLECGAIRVVFAQGTMAPIAQMECWIDLTDDRRRFLVEKYDYMRAGGRRR